MRHTAALALLTAVLVLAVRRDRLGPSARARDLTQELRRIAARGPPGPHQFARALAAAQPHAAELARAFLAHPDWTVRAGAAEYLGDRAEAEALGALIALLRDPEPRVRVAAAQALGALGDRRAAYFLRRAMASDELLVAEAARRALQRLAAKDAEPAPP